jgi:hypothetical protein
MKEKGIKNPFGDNTDDIPETEEEEQSDKSNSNSNITMKNGGGFQDDFVKKELAKSGINEDSLKIGYKIGEQIVKNSKFVDFFSLDGLKPYFDVDNKYVLVKLRYLFLPFLKEKSLDSDEIQNKYNIEYFDLYLPIMSFITYVLIISFITALTNPSVFNPQTLGKILSKDFSLYIINAALVKLLMFIFLNNPLSFTEIFALTGYKFIYMIIYVLFGSLIETKKIKYVVFLIFALLSALFTRKCLNKKLSDENFKNTIIYASLAADLCIMFLILL